jgi:ankyrin repeat protein
MFFWAILVIKEIEKACGLTMVKLEKLVQGLPSGLDALYDRMLMKISDDTTDEEDLRMIQKILTWVALAARPLTLLELRLALAIEPSDETLALVKPRFMLYVAGGIRTLCGSLLEVVPNDKSTTTNSPEPTNSSYKDSDDIDEGEDLTATVRLVH